MSDHDITEHMVTTGEIRWAPSRVLKK